MRGAGTIHCSQGMTLSSVIIDEFASRRFPNSPYVAISRVVKGASLFINPTAVTNLQKSDLYTHDEVLDDEKRRLGELQHV